ncbi:MAG: class I SAM-dependent methyltransferase [Thermoanaerobaculia bacterium]
MPSSSLKNRVRMLLYRRQFSTHFNTPVKFHGAGYQVNERIVELPFVFSRLPGDGRGRRLLEFGCTRSTLALSLASMGYEVTGVDLRPWAVEHPSFRFLQGNLLDLDLPQFDFVTSVSVIEHVGLGAYRENRDEGALAAVLERIAGLLAADGRAIVTVPCGQPSADDFLRSFAPAELLELCARCGLRPVEEQYFRRSELRYWSPCSAAELAEVPNAPDRRGRTGVNGVGCFVFARSG